MNRIEFVATIAIILFVAFALGWFCNWMVARMYRVTDKEIANLDEMGLALHTAEEERDQATTYLQQREAELMNQLTQTDAELTAAMGALRNSRLENEELRTYLEQTSAS
jgi:prophage endopeptidase